MIAVETVIERRAKSSMDLRKLYAERNTALGELGDLHLDGLAAVLGVWVMVRTGTLKSLALYWSWGVPADMIGLVSRDQASTFR